MERHILSLDLKRGHGSASVAKFIQGVVWDMQASTEKRLPTRFSVIHNSQEVNATSPGFCLPDHLPKVVNHGSSTLVSRSRETESRTTESVESNVRNGNSVPLIDQQVIRSKHFINRSSFVKIWRSTAEIRDDPQAVR